MPDLDELRSLAHQLQPPSLESLVGTARRRDRRVATVVAAGVAGVVATATAVVVVVTSPGGDDSTIDPAPSPSPSVAVPTGPPDEPTVSVPHVTPEDLRRWVELETVTNADPDRAGATELRFEVPVQDRHAYDSSFFCTGDPDTWYILVVGNDGASASGYCDSPIPESLPPLPTDISPFGHSGTSPTTVEVRMFVTGPMPQKQLDCLDRLSPPECLELKPRLEPLASTDVEFGVSIFEHWAPAVAEVAGEGVGALASIDGTDYVIHQVAQGPGDTGLTLDLDGARRELLVAVRDQPTESMGECGNSASSFEEERACQPGLALRLGGRLVRLERGTFGESGEVPGLSPWPLYRVPAGTSGQIELRVTRGDPDNVDLAMLVFEEMDS